jgi:hypothetical protein
MLLPKWPRTIRAMRSHVPYLVPLALLLTLAGLVAAHGQVVYPDPLHRGDDYYYVPMALHPLSDPTSVAHDPPFAYRLLTPLIVHALYTIGVSIATGYWLVTVAGLFGTTVALQWFLRGLHLSRGASVAGGLAFVLLGPASGLALWSYEGVEPVALLLLVLACGCAVHGRGWALVLVGALGGAAKEVVALGCVFALLWAWSRRDRVLLWWSVGGLAAFAATAGAIRVVWPARQGVYSISFAFYYVYDYLLRASGTGGWHAVEYVATRLLAATVGTWTVLLPIALLQFWHAPRVWDRWPMLLVLVAGAAAQIIVAIDLERLAVYGFPAVLAACCFEVEYAAEHLRVSRWLLWLPILAAQVYWWLPYAGWRHPYDGFPTLGVLDLPHQALTLFIAAAVAVTVLAMSRHAHARHTTPHASSTTG